MASRGLVRAHRCIVGKRGRLVIRGRRSGTTRPRDGARVRSAERAVRDGDGSASQRDRAKGLRVSEARSDHVRDRGTRRREDHLRTHRRDEAPCTSGIHERRGPPFDRADGAARRTLSALDVRQERRVPGAGELRSACFRQNGGSRCIHRRARGGSLRLGLGEARPARHQKPFRVEGLCRACSDEDRCSAASGTATITTASCSALGALRRRQREVRSALWCACHG